MVSVALLALDRSKSDRTESCPCVSVPRIGVGFITKVVVRAYLVKTNPLGCILIFTIETSCGVPVSVTHIVVSETGTLVVTMVFNVEVDTDRKTIGFVHLHIDTVTHGETQV